MMRGALCAAKENQYYILRTEAGGETRGRYWPQPRANASARRSDMKSRSPKHLLKAMELLRLRYRDFNHYNLADPLDELIFIICSTRTTEMGYRDTYGALRRRFPTNEILSTASVSEIADALIRGGLARKKAAQIHGILDEVRARFGRPALEELRSWADAECERFLLGLPGVGKKVARCVMLYALGRDVFPVDENCWRVSVRLGWIRRTRRNRSGSPRDEDRLQAKLPPRLRYSLHVNMISLGREFCTPKNPDCFGCPLNSLCPKIGTRREARKECARSLNRQYDPVEVSERRGQGKVKRYSQSSESCATGLGET
jgi:endonuclease III